MNTGYDHPPVNETRSHSQQYPVQPVRPPSTFLNFLLSLIPGLGQMYQGMMWRGTFFLVAFAASITLTSFLANTIPVLQELFVGLGVTAIILTYAYSFFDSIHTCRLIRAGLPVRGQFSVGDDWIPIPQMKNLASRGKTIIGIILVCLGGLGTISVLINRFFDHHAIYTYLRPMLQIIVPVSILGLGVLLLIKSRKKDA